jgi:hypothetical protein
MIHPLPILQIRPSLDGINDKYSVLNQKYSPRPSPIVRPPFVYLLLSLSLHHQSPLSKVLHSTRQQRPIIFRPFSLSLTTIRLHQTLITIDKSITYAPMGSSTSVKNIRQIRLFMQNKAKVKIGKMNLNCHSGKDYEKIHNRTLSENKPEQGQFPIILVY